MLDLYWIAYKSFELSDICVFDGTFFAMSGKLYFDSCVVICLEPSKTIDVLHNTAFIFYFFDSSRITSLSFDHFERSTTIYKVYKSEDSFQKRSNISSGSQLKAKTSSLRLLPSEMFRVMFVCYYAIIKYKNNESYTSAFKCSF